MFSSESTCHPYKTTFPGEKYKNKFQPNTLSHTPTGTKDNSTSKSPKLIETVTEFLSMQHVLLILKLTARIITDLV